MFHAFDNGSDLESFESLQKALDDLRNMWNEEETGPQTFVITNDNGEMIATMIRLADPELCLTVHSDGRTETHRCHYVLDESGQYVRSEVTTINATQTLTEWVNVRKRQSFPAH